MHVFLHTRHDCAASTSTTTTTTEENWMSGNYWHNTDDEIRYVKQHIGRAAGLIQPRGKFTKAQLLEGYIQGASNREWGALDGLAILTAAERELRKERGDEQ